MKVNARRLAAATRERGSALAISLIVVMVIASLGAGLIQMHGAIARRQMQSIDNKRALYIAEAGLSEAFMAITHGKSGNIGTEEDPALFGNGVFWVEAVDQLDNTVALVSNGLCESGRFSLAMVVRRRISPIAVQGLFGAESVTIGEGSIIDGYDSQAGSYDSQIDGALSTASTGQGAKITSNSDIQVDGSSGLGGIGIGGMGGGGGEATWVYGDALPGPKGSVLTDPDVLVSGSTAPALKPVRVAPMEPPTGLQGLSSLSHTDTSTPLVVSNAENQYRKVHVGAGSELVLEGPVTIMALGLIMESGSKLTIDTTNGPVMMYVTTYVDMADGSILENPTADPTQVALVIGGEGETDIDGDGSPEPSVNLNAEGEFYGLLYAPRADLSLPGDLRMFGCLSSKSVEFGKNSHFSYDTAMNTTGVALTGLPGLLSWRIVELPNAGIVKRRTDPIRWLRLQGKTLTPSHLAYVETHMHLEYLNAMGFPLVYDGPEASFNWAQVKTVKKMRWAGDLAGLATAPTSDATGKGMAMAISL